MKILLNLLFLTLCLTFLNCNDDDGAPPEKTFSDIDALTGMNLFDANGQAIGQWREPNINPGNVIVFPIPSLSEVFLQSQENVLNVWLISADCVQDVNEDIENESLTFSYSKSTVQDASERTFSIPNFQGNLALDFFDLPEGFYRLFYEMESGDIFWQNTYINKDLNSIPDISILDSACN